jgi:hypothetical protein
VSLYAMLAVGAASALLAGLRVGGHKSKSFQAVAHLFVGALFGYAYGAGVWSPAYFGLALSAVELATFVHDKLGGKRV